MAPVSAAAGVVPAIPAAAVAVAAVAVAVAVAVRSVLLLGRMGPPRWARIRGTDGTPLMVVDTSSVSKGAAVALP
ncbi:hypothetical protein GCM10010365_36590 [Streptomyces poonensis]|uniref:Uncharacterized protein n=1 Tax=Streptomyces poonensis TaxID=68255 RepID=A0A918PL58_9ACTN|nr:hypothetical protein GCM10010365_36590 [Streptomyces poonensis]GLJ91207.1 hypothetical protein GCM10017589_38130 [Streptomyces poonensis]